MAVWAVSGDHVLELLDVLGVPVANSGVDLEIPIFSEILAFCVLRREK